MNCVYLGYTVLSLCTNIQINVTSVHREALALCALAAALISETTVFQKHTPSLFNIKIVVP
jgi:hypothetical protein